MNMRTFSTQILVPPLASWLIGGLRLSILLSIGHALSASADTHYVSLAGLDQSPYTNWQSAAVSIQSAIDAASDNDDIVVSNGTYSLSSVILLNKDVEIKGFAVRDLVIVDGNNLTRCFSLSSPNAILNGLTIRKGNASSGAGVYCTQGTITNCLITGNVSDLGGGALCQGNGIIVDCLIQGNSQKSIGKGGGVACGVGGLVKRCTIAGNVSSSGSGVYFDSGGVVRECSINGNSESVNGDGGGAKMYLGGLLLNCTIYQNTSTWGGGVSFQGGGTAENCTIVSNYARYGGGIRNMNGGGYPGAATNCIIYFNTGWGSGTNYYDENIGFRRISYCCTTPAPGGTGNITNVPMFNALEPGSFHLLASSKCIDAGLLLPSSLVDFYSVPRPLDGNTNGEALVDIGAYEFAHPNGNTDHDGMPDRWEVDHGLNPAQDDHAEDPDGDRLTNLQEFGYGTDPRKSDTDNDTIPDDWEISHGLDPLTHDGTTDSDNDDLNNVQEYEHRTDPKKADTDNDGLNDGAEIHTYFTDPLDKDSDDDGYDDGVEVTYGTDPRDPLSYPILPLIVRSQPVEYGVSTPYGYGTNLIDLFTIVTNDVTSPVYESPYTRRICTGWQGIGSVSSNGATNRCTFMITTNSQLTWTWNTENLLTVGASENGGVSKTTSWQPADSNLTITATPSNGYHFAGWVTDPSVPDTNANPLVCSMTASREITARFAINQYTLVIQSNHGIPAPPAGIYTNAFGTYITNTVTSVDEEGATQFVCHGWAMTGHEPTHGITTNMMLQVTNNAVLTWLWSTNYWLGMSTSGSGTITPVTGWYAANTNLILWASPSNHHHLVEWTGSTQMITQGGTTGTNIIIHLAEPG